MNDPTIENQQRRIREAAERYIKSDGSDPFCAARVALHCRPVTAVWTDEHGIKHRRVTSISSWITDDKEPKPGFYDARVIMTEHGVQYIDRVRP